MKRYNGYYRFGSLAGVEYMPAQETIEPVFVRDKDADLLDLIFTVDPATNLPCGSLDMLLSDKTRDEVRTYIENVIMKDIPAESYPANLREELVKMDSDFLVKTSRNRFESVEAYEARVKSYFDEIEADKEYNKRIEKLNADLKALTSNK